MMQLTLGAIVAIFRDQLRLGRYRYVYDLMDTLLSDYLCEHVDYVLHPAAVSAWLHNRRYVPGNIVGFYCQPGADCKLAATIAEQILPHMPDKAVALEQMIALIRLDPTIHPETKDDLLADTTDIAALSARAMIYAMSRSISYIAADLQDAA